MSGLGDLEVSTGKELKTVPELYDDGLKSAVQESGKTLALLPRVINAALAPVRIWVAQKEYNVAETEKLLAKKLEKVGVENVVSPEAYVAVPALQAISYSMNSEELRDLYANLLSSAMTKDRKWTVHPSYVEVIKQITPDEAKLLKSLVNKEDVFPLVDVRLITPEKSYLVKVRNFTNIAEGVCEFPANIFAYLDNLTRLKILEIPSGVRITDDNEYKPLEANPVIQNLIKSKVPDGFEWEIEHKEFNITEYGHNFIDTCVKGL